MLAEVLLVLRFLDHKAQRATQRLLAVQALALPQLVCTERALDMHLRATANEPLDPLREGRRRERETVGPDALALYSVAFEIALEGRTRSAKAVGGGDLNSGELSLNEVTLAERVAELAQDRRLFTLRLGAP